MITVKNLTYPGANKETLHGLNFAIAESEIFGFLGPSGAGKTTTQNILIGLLKEYGGHVQVMGREVSEWGQDWETDVSRTRTSSTSSTLRPSSPRMMRRRWLVNS